MCSLANEAISLGTLEPTTINLQSGMLFKTVGKISFANYKTAPALGG